MRPNIKTAMCALAMSFAVTGCASVGPSEALNDEDRTQLAVARTAALEKNKTGQGTNWSNPKTGNRGAIVPIRTYKSGSGADCRDFQQTTTVGSESDLAYGTACRRADGAWEIVAQPSRYHPGDYGYNRFGYGFGHSAHVNYRYYRYRPRLYGW